MTGQFKAIVGIDTKNKRRKNDFYATPAAGVQALVVHPLFPTPIGQPLLWEPCSGDGAIASVLQAFTYRVIETDIEPQGRGEKMNFFNAKRPLAPVIVTNPPFALAREMIEHAWDLQVESAFFLLKATYWHAQGRFGLFQEKPPLAVMPLAFRLDFTGEGSPPMDMAWFMFTPKRKPDNTYYCVLPKPTDVPMFAEVAS